VNVNSCAARLWTSQLSSRGKFFTREETYETPVVAATWQRCHIAAEVTDKQTDKQMDIAVA